MQRLNWAPCHLDVGGTTDGPRRPARDPDEKQESAAGLSQKLFLVFDRSLILETTCFLSATGFSTDAKTQKIQDAFTCMKLNVLRLLTLEPPRIIHPSSVDELLV